MKAIIRTVRSLPLRLIALAVLGMICGAAVWTLHAMIMVPRTYVSRGTLVFPLPGEVGGVSVPLQMVLNNTPQGSSLPLITYQAVLTSDRALLGAGRAAGVDKLYHLKDDEAVAGWMRKAITFRFREDRVVEVRARTIGTPLVEAPGDLLNRAGAAARDDRYRKLSAELVPAVVDQMALIADDIQLDRSKSQFDSVSRRAAREREKLRQLTAQLAATRARLGNIEPDEYTRALTQSLVQTEGKLNDLDAEIAKASEQKAEAQRVLTGQLKRLRDLPDEVPLLAEARTAAREAEAAYNKASEMYGPQSPQVREAKLSRDQARARLQAASASARSGQVPELQALNQELGALVAQRASAQKAAAAYRERLRTLPVNATEMASLRAQLEAQRETVEQLQAELTRSEMAFEKSGVRWSFLDRPQVPKFRAAPSYTRALLVGALIGAFVAGWPLLWRLLSSVLRLADAD